jgi:hypothetical protein
LRQIGIVAEISQFLYKLALPLDICAGLGDASINIV